MNVSTNGHRWREIENIGFGIEDWGKRKEKRLQSGFGNAIMVSKVGLEFGRSERKKIINRHFGKVR
jgi:hypothetical protein